MEAIKKSMLNTKKENEKAKDRCDAAEAVDKVATARLDKIQKEFNVLSEECKRFEAEFKELEKEYRTADKMVDKKDWAVCKMNIEGSNISRKIYEIDEQCEISEKKLAVIMEKLEDCNKRSDESGRLNRMMESRAKTDKLRFKELEKIIKDVTTKTEEQEFKIEENSEIISIFEEDLETAETKGNNAELYDLHRKVFGKIATLREELQVVQNNLKSLENSAEASRLAEIELKRTIDQLNADCKKMETRAMHGDMHVQKLLSDIDKLAGDMKNEKEKMRSLSFEMEATLAEFK